MSWSVTMAVVADGRGEAVARLPIYVECAINAPLDAVWQHTQEPALHERWDLRFAHIEHLPRADLAEPQRFLYETQSGFGLHFRGEGECTETVEPNRTGAAFRFWSDDPRSPIRAGSGTWRCEPCAAGGAARSA